MVTVWIALSSDMVVAWGRTPREAARDFWRNAKQNAREFEEDQIACGEVLTRTIEEHVQDELSDLILVRMDIPRGLTARRLKPLFPCSERERRGIAAYIDRA